MSYIDRLNSFHLWLESNALEPVSQLLYFKLLNVFNRAGWPETVQVDNQRIMSMTGQRSEKAAIAARDRLVSSGLISYQRGKKGSPGRYALTPFPCMEYSEKNTVENIHCISGQFPVSYPGSNPGGNPALQSQTYKTKTKNKTKTDVSHREVSSGNETGILSEGCAEPSPTPPAPPVPPVFQIPLNDNSLFDVTAEAVAHWRELYPAVDVEQQFRKMIGWCETHKRQRKTRGGVEKFINGWLAKEQDRGGYQRGGYRQPPEEVPRYSRGTRMNPDGSWSYDPGDTSGSL